MPKHSDGASCGASEGAALHLPPRCEDTQMLTNCFLFHFDQPCQCGSRVSSPDPKTHLIGIILPRGPLQNPEKPRLPPRAHCRSTLSLRRSLSDLFRVNTCRISTRKKHDQSEAFRLLGSRFNLETVFYRYQYATLFHQNCLIIATDRSYIERSPKFHVFEN